MVNKINSAALSWNQDGEPYSNLFDDVYFSSDDGLAESRYVFIEMNTLVTRWQQCQQSHYVIAETGFGSGLNFLAVCETFEQFILDNPTHVLKRLYFISFEKYPLRRQDLTNAHARWPQLSRFSARLQANYPSAIAGCHRLNFPLTDKPQAAGLPEIVLDLWFGDISVTLPQLYYPAQGLVDAWFLDGFAPSKNPDMWCEALYKNIARVTKNDATLATFTAAGHVRRGLAAQGFMIKRVKGFGIKREMISATFKRSSLGGSTPNWYHRPQGNNISQVTIVGGGIASAALCLALAKRGIKITLLCQDEQLAQGASGNRQGGFYPLINSQHDFISQLYSQAFFYTKHTLVDLKAQGFAFAGEFCGSLQLAYNQKLVARYQQLVGSGNYPADFVQWLSPKQASEVANIMLPHPSLYFPQAGWLCPSQVTKALLQRAQTLSEVEVKFNSSVSNIFSENDQWILNLQHRQQHQTKHLILANGDQINDFTQTKQLPVYRTSGQVTHLDTTEQLSPLSTLLCYKGYLTPNNNGEHCIGASFERDKTLNELTEIEQRENISKLVECTDNAPWATTLAPDKLAGKVGVRMSAKDHLPMVGAIPDAVDTVRQYFDLPRGKPAHKYPLAPHFNNLYVIGALGSRGLCSANLLAEILACQLTQQPQPVSQALLNQLNPNRYWIKQLKSGKSIF